MRLCSSHGGLYGSKRLPVYWFLYEKRGRRSVSQQHVAVSWWQHLLPYNFGSMGLLSCLECSLLWRWQALLPKWLHMRCQFRDMHERSRNNRCVQEAARIEECHIEECHMSRWEHLLPIYSGPRTIWLLYLPERSLLQRWSVLLPKRLQMQFWRKVRVRNRNNCCTRWWHI